MQKLIALFLMVISLNAISQTGINWNSASGLAASTYSNLHPRVAVDASGNPLVIWGRASDESVFFSRWSGTSFSTPIKLNPSWLTVATASWMGPDIATHGDTVYIVVKRTPEASDTNHIYLIRSFNGGLSFQPPVRVDYIADSLSRFPTVTTDAIGNPLIAYMKFNAAFGASRWVVLRSADFGNTFSADVKASGWNGATGVCDCCPGSLINKGNFTAMLYRNNMSNIRDSWAGISNDGGATFSTGINVDNKNWFITSCPASGPDGVIVNDTLYSAFMSSASGSYRTYMSKTAINGLNVSSTKALTGAITGLTQQNYPTTAGNGNALAIVWRQVVSGVAQLPLLFTNDVSKGLPTNADTVDLADVTNADVALSKNKIFVVWEDDNAGVVRYRIGNYPASTNGIESSDKNMKFTIFPNPSSSQLNINCNHQAGKLSVTNIYGEEVFSSCNNEVEFNFQLDISGWRKGIYLITLQSDQFVCTQKIIKE